MLKRKPKVLTPAQVEELRTKDFFDMILPGTVKFFPDHYIVGDSSMEYCCLEGASFDETDTVHVRMNRCSYNESEWLAERDDITQTM